MCRDQVSNSGPLALVSDALPTAITARQLLVYDDSAPYEILKFWHKCFLRYGMLKSVTNGQTD